MAAAVTSGETTVLDLLGLHCPLPAMKTRRALARLAPGARLVVMASDPLAAIDLPHLCAEDGHRLVGMTEAGGVVTVEIERGGRADGRDEVGGQPTA